MITFVPFTKILILRYGSGAQQFAWVSFERILFSGWSSQYFFLSRSAILNERL